MALISALAGRRELRISHMSIRVEVLNALRWSAAGRLAGQLGSWIATIYVIRILNPADYGLMGMASILIGLAALFNELGVIPALIQSRHLDERLTRQLFGFVITSTAFIFCLLFLAAPLLSAFFDEPRLTPVTRAPRGDDGDRRSLRGA